jgi:phage host-nuclease inhibitor protein Gam
MTTRIKLPTLKTREDFDFAIGEVAQITVQIRKIEAARDHTVQAIQAAYGGHISPLQARCNALVAQAEQYAEAHRDELLPGKLKSADTPLATFGFRTGMPALKLLSKWTWEKVLEHLRTSYGLDCFIRNKPDVDKAKIIAATEDGALSFPTLTPDGEEMTFEIPVAQIGVKIVQEETFFIEPKLDDASQVKATAAK